MSDGTELCFTPATTLRERIRDGELSPVEVLDAVLDRIDALDDRVHAFVTLDAERAKSDAQQAEAAVARGDDLGPLHGVPVSIKDLEPTAGLRTTYGTKFFETNIPDVDGVVTERMRAAGAIIIGKTNVPAWGHKDTSDNLLMPATRTPWDLNRTAGGSSGGAAAAVAAGFGPLAHGTDSGGSIRIPAALCGVFGLKPSFGRVPLWPNRDPFRARSHAGPMTRTVDDAALMLSSMAGPDSRDPLSLDSSGEDYLAACGTPLGGLRIAWSGSFGGYPADPDVRVATESAVRVFEELGCTVHAIDPDWDDPGPWFTVLSRVALANDLGKYARERPEWIDPTLAQMIEFGARTTKEQHLDALSARAKFYDEAHSFMKPYDLLVTPTVPCGAWPYKEPSSEVGRKPKWDYVFPFDLLGWPAASVPCGFTSDGLPIGLQIVAGWHQDALCLRAAKAFETARPWAQLRPPLEATEAAAISAAY